jgi:hypothetical protein
VFETTAYQPFSLAKRFEDHVPMVTLVRRSGEATALPYFTLARLDYSPSLQAVEAVFGPVAVELHGRHLGELFGHLSAHQVVAVYEATSAEARLLGVSRAVVERVVVRAA